MKSQHVLNVFLFYALTMLFDVADGSPSYCKCSEYVPRRAIEIRIATAESDLEMESSCVRRRTSCHQLHVCVPWSTNQTAMENLECCCRPQPGHYYTRDIDMYFANGAVYFNEVEKCQPVACRRF